MKKQLLLIILPILLFSVTIQAQIVSDEVWDLGGNTSEFPAGDDYATTTTIRGLNIVPGGSTFGKREPNAQTWPDGYTSVNRFRGQGSSAVGTDGLPTRRYFRFEVGGAVAVKVWYRFSGTSTPRALIISDGNGNVLAKLDSPGDTDTRYLEVDYTGKGTDIHIFSSDNAVNYYKIEVSSTLLSNKDVNSKVSTHVQAVGNQVLVSNVTSATSINVYTLTGALVKSLRASSDTRFSLKSGFYIATVKTIEGEKSVKLLVR
ncbi:T9SS type A sorting domain-containing protein [Pseudotamlana carrageenivorans]|uniref:Secretion system C-terminal sorting domain-containing protein n=1 Tax=Pseudotamlana carrageenivorans TaxID=2069432 RepID=A0A2I7SEK2_9FLAO|nr:T9SS type A sorting domain-containing protein [Tamlana carrageenivorans]AUS04333.1 hypothetical protein C1A40_02075 [Tamlana carrageenivorans]